MKERVIAANETEACIPKRLYTSIIDIHGNTEPIHFYDQTHLEKWYF